MSGHSGQHLSRSALIAGAIQAAAVTATARITTHDTFGAHDTMSAYDIIGAQSETTMHCMAQRFVAVLRRQGCDDACCR